jgi:hypothetical protein
MSAAPHRCSYRVRRDLLVPKEEILMRSFPACVVHLSHVYPDQPFSPRRTARTPRGDMQHLNHYVKLSWWGRQNPAPQSPAPGSAPDPEACHSGVHSDNICTRLTHTQYPASSSAGDSEGGLKRMKEASYDVPVHERCYIPGPKQPAVLKDPWKTSRVVRLQRMCRCRILEDRAALTWD